MRNIPCMYRDKYHLILKHFGFTSHKRVLGQELLLRMEEDPCCYLEFKQLQKKFQFG